MNVGLSKLFKYEYPLIPYRISRQPNNEELCYEITNEMELKFTFLKCSDEMAHLIWRFDNRILSASARHRKVTN